MRRITTAILLLSCASLSLNACGNDLSNEVVLSFSGLDDPDLSFGTNEENACNNGSISLDISNETSEDITITGLRIQEVLVAPDQDMTSTQARNASIFTITTDDSMGTKLPMTVEGGGGFDSANLIICTQWSDWRLFDVNNDGSPMALDEETTYARLKLQVEGYFVDSKTTFSDSGTGIAYLDLSVRGSAL